MQAAEAHCRQFSPETPQHNAWTPSGTREGEDYWSALQTIRGWTEASHFAIHDLRAGELGFQDAASVRRQIEHYGLAEIVDTIEPYGSMMAGNCERDAPWRRKHAKDPHPTASLRPPPTAPNP